jgi:hypothetical protein
MGYTTTGSRRIDCPATWAEACLGAASFLAWGAAIGLYEIFHAWWIVSLGVCLILFFFCYVWGWVKGFPRWWFAFAGLLAIISAWMMSMPAFNNLPLQTRNGLLGFWAWLPLALTSLVLLIIYPDSLGKLLHNIWQDWTLLSFALYGTLAWLVWVMLDEIMSPLVPVCLATAELLLAAGALAYMRARHSASRFLSLLVGMTLALLPGTYANAIYWNGLQAPWMGNPEAWTGVMLNMLQGLGALALILLIPGLLGLVHLVIRSRRAK